MSVKNVLSPLPDTHPKLQLATRKEACADGQAWAWDGVRFEILHPAEAGATNSREHDNERSCVLRISSGAHSVLLAADIENGSEHRLLALHPDKLPATLLVAPHHGSKTSSSQAFVDAVHPRHVVFTAGYRNRFGHPREEVAERYRAAGSEVLRSDEDGAISIVMDAQGLKLERYRRSHARYWQHVANPAGTNEKPH
jgi:competence protein ComEC